MIVDSETWTGMDYEWRRWGLVFFKAPRDLPPGLRCEGYGLRWGYFIDRAETALALYWCKHEWMFFRRPDFARFAYH